MIHHMKRLGYLIAFFLPALMFCGCEAFNPHPLNIAAMSPNNPTIAFYSTGKSLALGKFTGPNTKGENIFLVTTLDLKNVLVESLKESRLFSAVEIEPNPKADYTLTASIRGQPEKGVLTVRTGFIVEYKIIRNATGEVVFHKTIFGRHTVSAGKELVGVTRMRMSVQGAVKDNVNQLLTDISQLNV